MKYIQIIIIGLGWSLVFASCSKFLDIKPEDRFLAEQVFENQSAIHSALNGIYINMAKPELYGSQLTMKDLDIMAQYYKTSNSGSFNIIASYNYRDASTQASFGAIWQSSYRAVLNINTFIERLQLTKGVIDGTHKNILLGEGYAIRAYLLFDMLRLFGPVYKTDSLALAIPYPTIPTDQIQPILKANAVMDSVIRDIDRSLELLKDDPIRNEGVKAFEGADPNGNFYRMRNRRFNYYGAMALKARVLLYRQDQAGALHAAKSVIEDAERFFTWTPGGSTLPNIDSPDRNFSSEIIVGMQNTGMYDQQRNLFAATLFDYQILAPISQRLDEVFNSFLNDYRYRVNWRDGGSAGKTYKTFVKYESPLNTNNSFRFFQSLIRITELYYIAAECTADREEALRYLNTVRINRGLPNLGAGANITTELFREYRREFWGEGQTFFFFKRLGQTSIPSGNTNGLVVEMDAAKYVVPLPVIETQNR